MENKFINFLTKERHFESQKQINNSNLTNSYQDKHFKHFKPPWAHMSTLGHTHFHIKSVTINQEMLL